jgi:hypothetical protein
MLNAKDFKLKTNVPPLFKQIINNDVQRRLTKSSPVVSFAEHKRLKIEHQDLMIAAEIVVAGTKNNGKTLA